MINIMSLDFTNSVADAMANPPDLASLKLQAMDQAASLWKELEQHPPEKREAVLSVLYDLFGQSCLYLCLDCRLQARIRERAQARSY